MENHRKKNKNQGKGGGRKECQKPLFSLLNSIYKIALKMPKNILDKKIFDDPNVHIIFATTGFSDYAEYGCENS